MMKFNLAVALTKGCINLYKLQDKDTYVLVLVFKDNKYIIPLIKDASGALAYIGDGYSIPEYTKLSEIVKSIFTSDQCVYKNMYTYIPIRANSPEYAKIITDYIKPYGGKKSDAAESFLLSQGFVLPEEKEYKKLKPLDYSEVMKNPEAKLAFDIEAYELAKVQATYEGLSPELRMAAESISQGLSRGIILEGPTGTGKSSAARIIANHMGAPIKCISINEGTEADAFIGQWVPDSENHGYKFVKGPLLVAYTDGWQAVIEEVTFGRAGTLAQLNPFLDSSPMITINGETYKRNPNFIVYMTMNPGYKGTDPLNVALKNRFAKINVPSLSKKEFCKRACAYSKMLGHELSSEFFEKLYNFSAVVEKEGRSSRWHEEIKFSVRNAQRLCDCILQKKCNYEEFSSAVAIQYLNDLSTDNDNSDELEEYKQLKDTQDLIKDLYTSYDFSAESIIKVEEEFESFFTIDETDKSKTSEEKKMEEVSSIFDKF